MKTVLVLAVLVMAAPAWATVYITCTADGNEVTVDYNAVSESSRVRGFALDITVKPNPPDTNDVNIIEIFNYHVGDNNHPGNRGYGIFPGSFGRLDETDINFPEWKDTTYSPLAWKVDYPNDTLAGLDTNGITVETGSLFYPVATSSPNAPPKFGTLLKFYTDSDDYTVTIGENAIRGGVVSENSSLPSVDCTPCTADVDCFPSTHKDYAAWVDAGKPECWCSKGMQCYGDADGKTITGKFATYSVSADDLSLLVAGWQRADGLSGSGGQSYDCEDTNDLGPSGYWDGWVCADFNRSKIVGKFATYRISADDLSILVWNWQNNNAGEDGGDPNKCCPTKADCLSRGH